MLPTSVFWLGKFHVLYSPWGHKESDTTEQLSLHFTLYYGVGSVKWEKGTGVVTRWG